MCTQSQLFFVSFISKFVQKSRQIICIMVMLDTSSKTNMKKYPDPDPLAVQLYNSDPDPQPKLCCFDCYV